MALYSVIIDVISSYSDLNTCKTMCRIYPNVKALYVTRIKKINIIYGNFEQHHGGFDQTIFYDFVHSDMPNILIDKKNMQTYDGVVRYLHLGYCVKEFNNDLDRATRMKFYKCMFAYNYRFSKNADYSLELLTFIDINISKIIRLLQSYEIEYFSRLQHKFKSLYEKYHNIMVTDIANINF